MIKIDLSESDTLMTRASLSSDYGWGDSDEPGGMGNVGATILLIGTLVYGASLWMTSGLLSLTSSRNSSTNEYR